MSASDRNASGHASLRRTVLIVALLKLACFKIEFAVALGIGSVSLFAEVCSVAGFIKGKSAIHLARV
ncbi:hypothetical protein [Rhodanobacter denitrificans]|uniref:hypothetical protein n=1 Tax=Rhodanobacter denitrificans TaxID=666685 RepID=UPI001F45EEA3|nr:hypothetical protein [Rhodanobacter denitrificans]UJJ58317.1 hypothetical protein LRK55_17010 [Rhodanobacter denitrificans]